MKRLIAVVGIIIAISLGGSSAALAGGWNHTLTATPSSLPADGVSLSSLTFQLTDANTGQGVGGQSIYFYVNAYAPFISNQNVTTDSDGYARTTIKSAIAGTYSVTAYLNGNIPYDTTSVTFTAYTPPHTPAPTPPAPSPSSKATPQPAPAPTPTPAPQAATPAVASPAPSSTATKPAVAATKSSVLTKFMASEASLIVAGLVLIALVLVLLSRLGLARVISSKTRSTRKPKR